MESPASQQSPRATGPLISAVVPGIGAAVALIVFVQVLAAALQTSFTLRDLEVLLRMESPRFEGGVASLPAGASVASAWMLRQWGAGAADEWIFRIPAAAWLLGAVGILLRTLERSWLGAVPSVGSESAAGRRLRGFAVAGATGLLVLTNLHGLDAVRMLNGSAMGGTALLWLAWSLARTGRPTHWAGVLLPAAIVAENSAGGAAVALVLLAAAALRRREGEGPARWVLAAAGAIAAAALASWWYRIAQAPAPTELLALASPEADQPQRLEDLEFAEPAMLIGLGAAAIPGAMLAWRRSRPEATNCLLFLIATAIASPANPFWPKHAYPFLVSSFALWLAILRLPLEVLHARGAAAPAPALRPVAIGVLGWLVFSGLVQPATYFSLRHNHADWMRQVAQTPRDTCVLAATLDDLKLYRAYRDRFVPRAPESVLFEPTDGWTLRRLLSAGGVAIFPPHSNLNPDLPGPFAEWFAQAPTPATVLDPRAIAAAWEADTPFLRLPDTWRIEPGLAEHTAALLDGWYVMERWGKEPIRWAAPACALGIELTADQAARIRAVRVRLFPGPGASENGRRSFELYENGQRLATWEGGARVFGEMIVPWTPAVRAGGTGGRTVLRIVSRDRLFRGPGDLRVLSAAIPRIDFLTAEDLPSGAPPFDRVGPVRDQ